MWYPPRGWVQGALAPLSRCMRYASRPSWSLPTCLLQSPLPTPSHTPQHLYLTVVALHLGWGEVGSPFPGGWPIPSHVIVTPALPPCILGTPRLSLPGSAGCVSSLSVTSSMLTSVSSQPVAAGSGIPQIKCFLNGVKIPHVVRLKVR